ncbi:transmembrane 6 superfamily member 1-like [Ciona intestinalis]
MANFIGVLASCFISLSGIPLVVFVTNSDVLSQPINLMVIGFTSMATIVVFVYLVVPPNGIKKEEGKEGRGVLYYTCCLFMWASMTDLALQSQRFGLFGLKSGSDYFDHGEPYLDTPFGLGVQGWNGIVNYLLYIHIIYNIDNNKDPRYTAIYWAGGILTSQFCVIVGAYSGSFATYLPPSVAMNIVFVVFPMWVFFHFLNKPRSDKIQPINSTKYRSLDIFLIAGLLVASFFMIIRGLGALDSPFPLTKYYVTTHEPYIMEPGKFGATWVLYGFIYGVPFQLFAIYGLLHSGCDWMIDLVVFYAAGMLQGTCVYMAYTWFPMSNPEYHIPQTSMYMVIAINVFLVFISNLLLWRCFAEPQYFVKGKLKKN